MLNKSGGQIRLNARDEGERSNRDVAELRRQAIEGTLVCECIICGTLHSRWSRRLNRLSEFCSQKCYTQGEKRLEYIQRPEIIAAKKTKREQPDVKAAEKAYRNSPEVKAKNKAYQQRPDVKAMNKAKRDRSEIKAAKNAAAKAYYHQPEVKAAKKAYNERYNNLKKISKGEATD